MSLSMGGADAAPITINNPSPQTGKPNAITFEGTFGGPLLSSPENLFMLGGFYELNRPGMGFKADFAGPVSGFLSIFFDYVEGADADLTVFGLKSGSPTSVIGSFSLEEDSEDLVKVFPLNGFFDSISLQQDPTADRGARTGVNHLSVSKTDPRDQLSAVPLPAAGWLLLAGVGGLAALRRRQKVKKAKV